MGNSTDCHRTRLTPFEEYMLGDDRPDWPMTFWIRLEFSQSLESARLARAVTATSARHPLLSARIVYDRRRHPHWVPSVSSTPETSVRSFDSTGSTSQLPPSPPFNLETECAWRVWKGTGESDRAVWLEMHHAACDGIGAFRVVEDLLVHYRDDLQQDAAKPPLPLPVAPDWGQLSQRHRCDNLPGITRRLGQWAWMIWRIAAYSSTKPACLDTVSCPDGIPIGSMQASEHRTRSLGAVADFRRAARLADCTLNDLVIHRLFGALRDLFARRDPLRRHRLRLFIPMDLRGNPHNQCQVGNSVGMLHIDRVVGPSVRPGDGPSDVDAPSLASVAKDMKVYRKYQMGRALIVSLEASIGLLGSPRWMLSPKYCGATCVLTNLKAPLSDSSLKGPNGRLQVGSVMLESVDLFPPVRPMTPACFGLLTYGDELRLNLRFQPATFPVDDAEYLLARLTDLLHQTVATSRDPGQVDL